MTLSFGSRSKKSSIRKQDWTLKDSLFLCHFTLQCLHRSLRKQLFKKVKCHIVGGWVGVGGGRQKSEKKCHVLFEWPLNDHLRIATIPANNSHHFKAPFLNLSRIGNLHVQATSTIFGSQGWLLYIGLTVFLYLFDVSFFVH